jgi:hypothetical protein
MTSYCRLLGGVARLKNTVYAAKFNLLARLRLSCTLKIDAFPF